MMAYGEMTECEPMTNKTETILSLLNQAHEMIDTLLSTTDYLFIDNAKEKNASNVDCAPSYQGCLSASNDLVNKLQTLESRVNKIRNSIGAL
jgi:hypothetical protein